MKLTDVLPIEKWVEIEKEIHEKSGLSASVFDINGMRITDYKKWVNELCPVIKATEKGQSYICAVANQNLTVMAKNSQKPVVLECDAGLVKIVAPIFIGDEFVGSMGGCGLILDDGETDSFLVNKTTGIDAETVENLSQGIAVMTTEKAEAVAAFLENKTAEIAAGHQQK